MAKYNITIGEDSEISLSNGNKKIGKGVWSFSTLPGDKPLSTEKLGPLTDIKGTCTGVCEGCKSNCYAIKLGKLHHNVCISAWGKNTLMIRKDPVKVAKQLISAIDKYKIHTLRYNVSGEIENLEQLNCIVHVATSRPNTIVYLYTKQFEIIKKYLSLHEKFPDNLVINISEWHGNSDKYNFDKAHLNIFAYDDGTDPKLKSWVHCPAVDAKGHETGIQCKDCKRCMKNKGYKTAVYAH